MTSDAGGTTPKALTVTCPRCGKNAVYGAENPSRPFCSERCRLIDLGAWANESYRIPEKAPPDGNLSMDSDDD